MVYLDFFLHNDFYYLEFKYSVNGFLLKITSSPQHNIPSSNSNNVLTCLIPKILFFNKWRYESSDFTVKMWLSLSYSYSFSIFKFPFNIINIQSLYQSLTFLSKKFYLTRVLIYFSHDKTSITPFNFIYNFVNKLYLSSLDPLIISRQYLSDIIRDNNITRKRATFKHFPKTYRGNIRNEQQELKEFFDVINKFKLEDIISIDETSVSTTLTHNYCRAFLGDRCVKKTTNNEVFKKYSLVVAINNKKCIATELYQNGAVNSERFNDFWNKYVAK